MEKDLSYVHRRINLRSYRSISTCNRFLKGLDLKAPLVRFEKPFRTDHTCKKNQFISKF